MLISETLTKCFSMLHSITNMLHLQQLQAQLMKLGLDHNTLATGKLVAFSAISPHGDLKYGCSLLTHTDNPTKFMWNSIIRGFSQSKDPHKTFIWYSKMINTGISPDRFTFPFVLKACSRLFDLKKGQQIHTQIIKIWPSSDPHIDSSLVYLYASCGEFELANAFFKGIEFRNVVTWNVMISGCLRSGRFINEGLNFFHQMRLFCVEGFDEFSLVSVTSACANFGALSLGKWIHGLVCKSGFCEVVPLGNALVDMYGKCGSMGDACKLFDEMGVRNIVSWGTMIDVCAIHGCGRHAINVFDEMERIGGIEPDDMMFTSVLCACSHAGLLCEGKIWFNRMRQNYKITPKIQHFGCMVDLLGKAGQLKEAYELVREMHIEPDTAIWRSLVGACLYHGDLDLAHIAASQLSSSNLDDPGDIVILSNLYARIGQWDDVERLRGRSRKNPGYSFIEVCNVVHEFVTRDTSHQQIDEIYLLINQMVGQFTVSGYV